MSVLTITREEIRAGGQPAETKRELTSEEIAQHVAAFIEGGGKIQYKPWGESGQDRVFRIGCPDKKEQRLRQGRL